MTLSTNFKERLSQRIDMDDMLEITYLMQEHNERKQELYDLLYDSDDNVAYQAAWVLTHLSLYENRWLYDKQNELIDEALTCPHAGKRRLILTLLYRQPLTNPPRVDFLDFCLERMLSKEELPGVQSLCMKLAYELCRPVPELLQELKAALEMMETDLQPSMRTVRKNVLKAMQQGKSLQSY
ncbi:hypothetical protein [Viscerimonas tarda]